MASFVQNGKKVSRSVYPPATCLLTRAQIVAIGRNFVEHVRELNNTVPKEPFFFLKPTSSYLPSGGKVLIPRGITAHHEGEHAVRALCAPVTTRTQSSSAS